MLQTQTANLPLHQRQRLHDDFLANEKDYLRLRGGLLVPHRGQWVAVQGGQVIASGQNLVAVTEAASAVEGHPYIARVGEEEACVFRVRRTDFAATRCDVRFLAYAPLS